MTHSPHQGVLDRQFATCTYFQHDTRSNSQRPQPTRLAIFDFDSTLFYSPLLSPTIWHPTLVHALTSEGLCGPGWWRDIRSLQLGADVEQTHWKGYWNPGVMIQVQAALEDPKTLTVLLTGRRVHPFYDLVSKMLKSQGLDFDMVCLRPDPEEPHGASVFDSTMDYKLSFLLHLLHTIPTIQSVDMWDDRPPHVRRFQDFLNQLCTTQGIIKDAAVHFVHGIRPRYNPKWEHDTVDSILGLTKTYTLVPIASSTVITLDPSTITNLTTRFHYNPPPKMTGEVPVLFADSILLSLKPLSKGHVPFGGIGARVEAKVVALYEHRYRGLFLKVRIRDDDDDNDYSEDTYCLPLYFKPSERSHLSRFHEWQWEPVRPMDQLVLHGKVDYSYLYGLDTPIKHPKRKRGN